MKATVLYAMAAMMSSLDPSSPNFQNVPPQGDTRRRGFGDISRVNTPGNFKKCPKGAQEFTFGYAEGGEFKCYARTEEMAYKKYRNFLNKR